MAAPLFRVDDSRRLGDIAGTAMLGLLLLGTPVSLGCRAIARIGESRQSLAARKLSREGMEAMRRGHSQTAERLFADALAVSDDDDRAHRGLAESKWNRGEQKTAIEHMEKAVRLSAGDPKLITRLGEMYFADSRLEDAEHHCQLALDSNRKLPETWALRGDCLHRRSRDEEALAAYHRALALQPDYPSVQLRIAELYLQSQQFDRVLATLDSSGIGRTDVADTAEAVTSGRIHLIRGIALRNLNQPRLAAKEFDRAIVLDPRRAEPHLQLAAIKLESGQPVDASLSVERAMQLDRELVVGSGWSEFLPVSYQSPASPTAASRIAAQSESFLRP